MPKPKQGYPAPRSYPGVMVSSTFTDLEQHRQSLVKAIEGQSLFPVVMENDSAKADVDVLDSSLRMVQEASAYVGVISLKYGQTPLSSDRNPDQLSLTELEFNEAQRLGRPILLFIMGEAHLLRKADIEAEPVKQEKLNAFRERAKHMGLDSQVHRVYATFDSLEDFAQKAIHAVSALRRYLDDRSAPSFHIQDGPVVIPVPTPTQSDPVPIPPAFCAEPPYIGSHQFVGRQAQLDVLSDWADPADPHPVLLFDAIGGSGKSMLTWQWITKRASEVRGDWSGRFWYSFYERGAIMADFCQRALSYITRQPLADFRKVNPLELGERLLHHLRARPWLIVLDGLERVLVAYHRFDAAQVPDEEASQPTDKIVQRDPCTAIRPEDDDLLRALAAAAPSKLLFTSRLVPRVWLNPASQPIPGVLRQALPGLRPADAEALIRSCGISGDSQAIQSYLKSHCDCHPLVTGILAGLINDYLPDKGNFDAWVADPAGGGHLNLANLDLVQKRNHILKAALCALPGRSHQLLSTLALVSEAVDYSTLSALNPHLPPEPEDPGEPVVPPCLPGWLEMADGRKARTREAHQASVESPKKWEQAVKARRESVDLRAAPKRLTETVRDLERRGLLQYDRKTKRYDLHPVVRGITSGCLRPEENAQYGRRVVDYFSQQHHRPYEEVDSIDDLRAGLQVVRTLLKMGRHQEAADTYIGGLAEGLSINLEAHAEILTLLRPFFPQGWAVRPIAVDEYAGHYLVNDAAVSLASLGQPKEAMASLEVSLLASLEEANWYKVIALLTNISLTLRVLNRLAREESCLRLARDLATLLDDKEYFFRTQLDHFEQLAEIGRWADAEVIWQSIDSMGRDWDRCTCAPGTAESCYAKLRMASGSLKEDDIARAENVAITGKSRAVVRALCRLRGRWHLDLGEWDPAAKALHEALCMAHALGQADIGSDTELALAKFHLGQLRDPHREAEQLASARAPAHGVLAELWLAIGDRDQSKKHALLAYKWAWADGEPYVHRYELNKTRVLLEKLGADIPTLLPYDPAKDERLFWEDKVATGIERLRSENDAERKKERD